MEKNKFQEKNPVELLSEALVKAEFERVESSADSSISFHWRDHFFYVTLTEDCINFYEPFFMLLKTGSQEEEFLDIVLEKYYQWHQGNCILKKWEREDGNTLWSIYCSIANTYPVFDYKYIANTVLFIAHFGDWIESHLIVCMKDGGWPYD